MEWAVEGTDLAREPISQPAHKYQDIEFNDELSGSDPAHPLFPDNLWSINAPQCEAKNGRLEDAAGW